MEALRIVLDHRGIIPELKGGLGNQLFIVSAAYVAAHHLKCPLYIFQTPPETNPHATSGISYGQVIFRHLGILVPEILSTSILHTLLHTGCYTFHESGHQKCFEPWTLETSNPLGLIFSHYYQYYPMLQSIELELRCHLLQALHDSPYFTSIPSKTRAFIHIRRGDFVNLQHIHFLQPIEYYQSAVQILQQRNPSSTEFLLCSDDIEWVLEQPFFKYLPNTLVWKSSNEIETLCAMICCEGGAICANSSFSWWGAFLGAHASHSPCIVPSKWFITPPTHLFPSEWIVI